jgi:serine/threonine-protein kinase
MQIAEGLDACHQKGILHGLLKPANLLVTFENQVKILDFGVGSLMGETESESVVDTMSTANTMASSLECASPESIMDPTSVSPASDQYSLGCILYFCLAGQYPFPGNNAVEKMMLHQTKEPIPVTDLAPETPPELVAIVERLMRKSAADRYPAMNDVVMTLRPLAMGGLGSVSAPSRPALRPVSAPRPTQAAPAWQGGEPGMGGEEPEMPPLAAPAFGEPTFDEPPAPPTRPPMARMSPPGGAPAMPRPDQYGQPPMPDWRNQPAPFPEPMGADGGFLPPPPMPNLPGRELFQNPAPPVQAGGHTGPSNALIIFGFIAVAVISMAAGAALIFFLK